MGMVPPRILRPRTRAGDSPLVDPAPDAFPLHYRSPYIPPANETPARKSQQYNIHNPAVIDALETNGYECQPLHPGEDGPWYLVNIHLEHGEQITLRDGSVLIAWGSALKTMQEDKEQDAERGILTYPFKTREQSPDSDRNSIWEHPSGRLRENVKPMWGVSAQQAAEALAMLANTGRITLTPEPIGGQYNGATLTLMKEIEKECPKEVEPIGDSSSGIDPCGYEEL